MQPVAGYVLDVLGTKIGYAMFAVLWAVFCGATALAIFGYWLWQFFLRYQFCL